MKNLLAAALFLVLVPSALWGADDIASGPSCKYCGMDRAMYGYSRMAIEYDQPGNGYFCSIHCAAVDLALNIDKAPTKMLVGDFNTKKLIDAEKAFWVIGGDRPGVMTKRAKWAFESKEDADRFIGGHGGAPATFDQAIAAAYEDMYQDTKTIRERRTMKRKAMDRPKQ